MKDFVFGVFLGYMLCFLAFVGNAVDEMRGLIGFAYLFAGFILAGFFFYGASRIDQEEKKYSISEEKQ